MGERRSALVFIWVLTCGASLWSFSCFARELRRDVTCYSDVLHVSCGKHSFIAVHSALFSTYHRENATCHSPAPEDEYIDDRTITESSNATLCREDVRLFVNRKCSGLKSCNYSYNQEPERLCFNPEGVLIVQYDCVREPSVNRYCNSKAVAPEGYIASPGFPQYYPALRDCSWLLAAADGQRVLLRLLHLHLRPAAEAVVTPAEPYGLARPASDLPRRCDDDSLALVHGVTKKWSVCGESKEALREDQLEGGEPLELRFRSVGFLPASGFLLYYKVTGCPSLPLAAGSYLVERNESWSSYACRSPRLFNDTLSSSRHLQCVRDHHWNDTLPPCVEPLEETSSATMFPNVTEVILTESNETSLLSNIWKIIKFPKDAGFVEDILIPCILIGILVLGNIVIVIIIFIIRRKQKSTIDDEDKVLEEINPPQPLVTEEDV